MSDLLVARRPPILTPEQFAKAALEVAQGPRSAPEYRATGAGLQPIR